MTDYNADIMDPYYDPAHKTSSVISTDPDYDPRHKASSIASTSTASSGDNPPSLCDTDSPALRPLVFEELLNAPGIEPIYLEFESTKALQEPFQCNASTNEEQPPPAATKRTYTRVLTEEQRRANHIASEQKRRSSIRNGFKELTELVPTLKNINHSKSTILFKAVEYVRHLEKRNRSLREKLASLQLRLEIQRSSSTTSTWAAWLAHRNQQLELQVQQLLARQQPSRPTALVIPHTDDYMNIPADDIEYPSSFLRQL